MAAWLEDDAQARGTTTAQALSDTLGVEDPDAFWTTVATNLDLERFRLIFVSDVIPPELRRIVEFLNGQMAQTEVLAIEVKQYVDDHARHQTIVPRVIGNTETAKRTKRAPSSGRATDRTSLLAALAEGDPGAADAAQALLDWGEQHPNLSVHWTPGRRHRLRSRKEPAQGLGGREARGQGQHAAQGRRSVGQRRADRATASAPRERRRRPVHGQPATVAPHAASSPRRSRQARGIPWRI